MPNLHVLMTNHSDVQSIKLLTQQLPFTKDHYETLIVECVPYGVKNEDVLKYLRKIMLTYVVDLTPVGDQLILTQTHLLALKNVFSDSLTDKEKMLLKYDAAEEIIEKNRLQFNSQFKQILYQFHYYHYLSEALKNGIELIGIEHPNYSPGAGIYQATRDWNIVTNTLDAMKEKQNCLMLVGASHGIDLIKANKQNQTFKNSYSHLSCDNSVIEKNSPSQLFKNEIETGKYSLSEYQSYLYLDLSQTEINDQASIFQDRVLATKSDKLVYHDYGRTPIQEKSSFCEALTQMSGLPFSMSFDQDYYADTTCIIDDKNIKQAAKAIQDKTGLGLFFKNDKGANVFVVKNTNAPENGATLRQALNKG